MGEEINPVYRTWLCLPPNVLPEAMLRDWLASCGLSLTTIEHDGRTLIAQLENRPNELPLTWERVSGALSERQFFVWPVSVVMPPAPAPIVIVPPPIAVPWWESLPEPDPAPALKPKIYSTHDGVIVYRSERADQPPNETTGQTTRRLARGQEIEVWHAPVHGSQWLCTFDGNLAGALGMVLWVKGGDMSPTRPA